MRPSNSFAAAVVLLFPFSSVGSQVPAKTQAKSLDQRVVAIIENKESTPRRMAAINLVQAFVCEDAVAALGRIAVDDTEDLWLRRRALSALTQYPARLDRKVIEAALEDSSDLIRFDAMSALTETRQTWAMRLLLKRLESPTESLPARIRAAMALSWMGAKNCSAALHALIQELGEADLLTRANLRYLSAALDLLTDPKHRSCLKSFLEGTGLRTLARAERAWVRLGGSAAQLAGKNRYGSILDAEQARPPRYRQENEQIRRAGWEKSTWQEFLLATEHVPVLFCGELHTGAESFLRKLQCQLVDHMSRPEGVELTIGYEPSALSAQKSIVEYATRKGLPALAMEKSWKEFCPLGAIDHRDLDCAEIANAYLKKAKARRLLVIRGQSHVNPNGFLLSKLSTKAVVLFTIPYGLGIPLKMMAGRLHAPGQVLRSRKFRNLWFVSVDMLGRDSLGRRMDGELKLLEALQK